MYDPHRLANMIISYISKNSYHFQKISPKTITNNNKMLYEKRHNCAIFNKH